MAQRIRRPLRLLALSPALLLTQCAPQCATAPASVTVTNVVDGDTLDLSTGERVRLIGIDAPEVGACGADAATARLEALALGQAVNLPAGARDDTDRYGRILRYVDVYGIDAGRTLIGEGLAIARYDSRDGYGGHPRQADYVALDAATPNVCAGPPSPAPPDGVTYANCDAVRAAGAAPIHPGEPGWDPKFDRDRDGVGCE
jgi:endonuclease YncB( thermonuclease family)